MLILALLWTALGLLCAGAGLALMGPAAAFFMRPADRFLFAAFLGLAVVGAVLLAWSLAAPVSPFALVLCAVLAFAGVVAQPAVRAGVREMLTDREFVRMLGAGLVLTVFFAERSTAAGDLNDAGAYHVGIVRWLSEYGTVHGMALVQDRLGFASSWLAWSAAFNHGELAGRTGTLMNGFLLLLCLGQLLLVALRMWRERSQAPDILALLAWLVLLPSILRWEMRISPSPDIPLFVMCIIVAWAILVVESRVTSQLAFTRARFMVLLLAANTFLMKLSGAPLLAAAGLYFVWAQRPGWLPRLGMASVACGAVLGLLAAVGLVASGCAFFPWPRLCTELPWSIGRAGAQLAADGIREWALGTLNRPQLHGIELLSAWIASNGKSASWIVLSLIAAAWLLVRRERIDVAGLGWAAAISAVGIPFLLLTAPAGRFGMSYLILLPLLALLTLRVPLGEMLFRRVANPAACRVLGIVATAVGALHVMLPLYKGFVESKPRARTYESVAHRKQGDPMVNAFNAKWWLIPNRYADLPGFTAARAYDFDYSMPPRATSLCWHHALPCTYNNLENVRLRDPNLGLSAGFKRERPAARISTEAGSGGPGPHQRLGEGGDANR